MMPGVGIEDDAFQGLGFAGNEAKKEFFDDHDGDENEKSKGSGRFAVLEQIGGGFEDDAQGGEKEHDGDRRGGEGLGFAVAIGMLAIGRFGGDDEALPDNDGTKNSGGGLDGVGDEGVGMAENAGGEFGSGQRGIDAHADESRFEAPFQPAQWHTAYASDGLETSSKSTRWRSSP